MSPVVLVGGLLRNVTTYIIAVFTERKNKGLTKASKKEFKEFKERNDKGSTSGGWF